MDFLNQLDTDNKDENSIFTFNDKNDNNNKGTSLPFPFSSQSSVTGGNDNNNNFLNDMKSQDNSFALSQFENDNNQNNNNNLGGLDFLNTICEVPESSNNIFDSQINNNDFLNPNVGAQNKGGLDFINEDNESQNNNNFDFSKFQSSNNEEPINIDINNLFKSTKTKKNDIFGKNEESGKNDNFEFNDLLNMSNKDKGGNNNENCNNEINTNENKMQINNNNIIPITSNSVNPINDIKEKMIDNNDIKNTSFKNNKMCSNPNFNNNNKSKKPLSNNFNPNPIPNKEKTISNNIKNLNNNMPSLSGPSSNPIINSINYNIKDAKDNNKENIPSFVNISIKPVANKPQKNKLDDLDQIISLNTKKENRQNIPSIQNNNINNNNLPINQQFFQGNQDNKKLDLGKDKLNFLTNELSNMFNSSMINGKRSEMDPKDKDIKNIENLLDFTKEKITPESQIKRNQNLPKDKNNKIYNQIKNNQNFFVNNTQKVNVPILKQLPSDSFDKKSQLIKLTKNDSICLSQMETSSKNIPPKDEKGSSQQPSKLEMIQKYNELASRLNKIREKAKEYRNLGNYFSQLIIATENYKAIYPKVLKKLLEEYNNETEKLLSLMKIKNNKMNEMNNEFFEEVKKYSLAFPDKI